MTGPSNNRGCGPIVLLAICALLVIAAWLVALNNMRGAP